jgi:AcrR family transcriptional regulator
MESNDMSPVESAPQSRAQGKQQTRARLLDAAMRQMASAGYQGATLDRIAAEAGCTKGALYWHFPNKHALFLALVEQSIAGNIAGLDALVQVNQDPAGLRSELGRWLDTLDEGELLPALGVELEIEARRDPSFRDLHRAVIERHETAMATFLDRYFALVGETPPLPAGELAAAIITIFKGFALCRHNRAGNPPRSSTVARLLLGMPLSH